MGKATAKGLPIARRAEAARGLDSRANRKRGRKWHFGEGRRWRALLICAGLGCLLVPTWASAGDPKRGEPMYQRYCSGCHGVDGRGGGKNFMPHVGALNRKGHTELLDDGYVASIITEGGPAYGKSGYMPSFKGTLSPDDIADVIAYVRSFPQY
jgi:mono/diheme cytochrome c family protein